MNSLSISNNVQNLTENLSQRLASLDVTINHPSLGNTNTTPRDRVESLGPTTELHSRYGIESTISASLNDGRLPSNRFNSFPQKAQSQMDAAEVLLGYHNSSTFLTASEIYSITHRHLNLLLGTLSITHLRKRHRGVRKEGNSDSILSWEVKIKFSPVGYFDKGLWARLWTNALGGCNVQQSLTVMNTVPSSDSIWNLVSQANIVGIRKEFTKKRYSVNTVDEYGRSLLGLVKKPSFSFSEKKQTNMIHT
jgi:hypothetical protein